MHSNIFYAFERIFIYFLNKDHLRPMSLSRLAASRGSSSSRFHDQISVEYAEETPPPAGGKREGSIGQTMDTTL